ncbi:Golgin subfamily A member 7/ERF4 family-domain-containing protein [Ampelomyces quisqualis]|uniref:Ras modification protein ERF4 n=1 Tax=Ampelomyces quisqualis TaxID=50730 RepID=A0A6A5QNW8_AMPQU|nr:Golgin subfamily A member 7/ERF4 family-domain-containing protein [Ampelomyces quisqualis]
MSSAHADADANHHHADANHHADTRGANAHHDVETGVATADPQPDFPWGPSHPCFPHPNPHVPLHSALAATTRIIRIKRDWMVAGDLAPTFANLYPEILDPLLPEDDFRIVIKKINDTLVDAFDPFTFRAWLDAVMGVATFWLWEHAGMTAVKRKLAHLERWIDHWNRSVGHKEAVKIIALRRTGYLTLDIQIPDPHLGPDNDATPTPLL